MASSITLTHSTGLKKTAYVGWSWTSFFFGGFPALFRGDIMGFFVWLVVAIVVTSLTAGFGGILVIFIWPAVYNRWHARRLIEKGYEITGSRAPIDAVKARVLG